MQQSSGPHAPSHRDPLWGPPRHRHTPLHTHRDGHLVWQLLVTMLYPGPPSGS